jgi:hypothetical protein
MALISPGARPWCPNQGLFLARGIRRGFRAANFGGKKLVPRFRIKIMNDELTQIDFNTKIEKLFKRV